MLNAGSLVERYEVLGLLGEGGMALVYHVRHRHLGSDHVLKVLAVPGLANQARLLREGQVQATLKHPNVVEVTDIIDVAGSPGLVMPLVDGPSLAQVLQAGVIDRDAVDALAHGICAGLAAAHAAGHVHRDLKPANVLLQLDHGRVVPKVADFGLVKRVLRDPDDAQTATGATMGTPSYMAPEQIRGTRDVDERADIWSLGALLYELATGQRAFAGGSPYVTFEAVLAHRFTPAEQRDPTLPARWTAAIRACLTGLPARAASVEAVFAIWSGGAALDTYQPAAVSDETVARWRACAPRLRFSAPTSAAPPLFTDAGATATWVEPTPAAPTMAEPAPVRPQLPAERDTFVGRIADLLALRQRLDAGARLITVLGFGGAGKTRLITRFGWTQQDAYPGGVWFCDLSEAQSEVGIADGVARALGVPLGANDPIQQLGHAIAGRGRCLLLLDNAEQVVTEAGAVVARWLDRAPEAAFVVTSRELLALPGEHVLALAPLPADDGVALFIARATHVKPDFVASDAASIAALVGLLDGLPLAIELAAARSRVMSPAKLLTRMTERFRLLASHGGRPARHATLRGTLDWSWALLSADEQSALAQLSVFDGGFTLASAEAVLSLDQLWPADAIQSLVDKSLVRISGDERFDLLVSVHEYAAEQLAALGSQTAAETRHGKAFARYGTDEALQQSDDLALQHAVERANLIAAARRAVARGDGAVAIATTHAAWRVLQRTGPVSEALALAQAVYAMPSLAPASQPQAAMLVGSALRLVGRWQEALEHFKRALDLARGVADTRTECLTLGELGTLHTTRAHLDEARHHYELALTVARQRGDRAQECLWMVNLGTLAKHGGHLAEARATYERALAIAREVGARRHEGLALSTLGNLHAQQGRLADAQACYYQAVLVARDANDRRTEAIVLGNLGHILSEQGRPVEAQARFRQAFAGARAIGDRRFEGHWLGNLALVSAVLGDTDAAQADLLASIAIAREVGDRRLEGAWYGALGELRHNLNQRAQSQADLKQGMTLLREFGDTPELGQLLCTQAQLDHAEGRDEAARAALDEAAALASAAEVGPDSELGRALAKARAVVHGDASASGSPLNNG